MASLRQPENRDTELSPARRLLQAGREELARAQEAHGEDAIIGLRNSCGKGWLAVLESVNSYLILQGIPEAELPDTDRGRRYFVGRYLNRNLRQAYSNLRQIFHISGYYEGTIELSDVPGYFDQLAEFIGGIESSANMPIG